MFLVLARSPNDPQRIRVASAFEMFCACLLDCLCVCKFSHFSSPHPPLIVLSPLLFIGLLPRQSTED